MMDLHARLVEVQRQIAYLQGQEAILRDMLGKPVTHVRLDRQPVKGLVLDYLMEVGDKGGNARGMVLWAEDRGQRVSRGTVSSLLSRLKNEGVVTYNGNTYRLRSTPPEGETP